MNNTRFSMCKIKFLCFYLILLSLFSCTHKKRDSEIQNIVEPKIIKQQVIVDCNYTFAEAIEGTRAPEEIIQQLKLINVTYYSTDNKIHHGQILTNIKIADKLEALFRFILAEKFPVAHAIPVVKYNWDDEASMLSNNTYSFCYRNESFSKHATGMAIDINPFFNPVRWKAGSKNRLTQPEGAHFDPSIPGTFYKQHPVVHEFKKSGFYWGHNFTLKYDDHHFEMQS